MIKGQVKKISQHQEKKIIIKLLLSNKWALLCCALPCGVTLNATPSWNKWEIKRQNLPMYKILTYHLIYFVVKACLRQKNGRENSSSNHFFFVWSEVWQKIRKSFMMWHFLWFEEKEFFSHPYSQRFSHSSLPLPCLEMKSSFPFSFKNAWCNVFHSLIKQGMTDSFKIFSHPIK